MTWIMLSCGRFLLEDRPIDIGHDDCLVGVEDEDFDDEVFLVLVEVR